MNLLIIEGAGKKDTIKKYLGKPITFTSQAIRTEKEKPLLFT
jgi:hypothetical protein